MKKSGDNVVRKYKSMLLFCRIFDAIMMGVDTAQESVKDIG
jgi:hypothetical protein